MKKSMWQWLVFFSLALAFLGPRQVRVNVEQTNSTSARLNDFQDEGCNKTPGVAEARPPARSAQGETMPFARPARMPAGCRAGGWTSRISICT